MLRSASVRNKKTIQKNPTVKTSFKTVLKRTLLSAMIAVIFTILAILVFALILKETELSESVISPVNQIIKILGIAFASFLASRKASEKNWIYGAAAGILYILISYFIFSIIEGTLGNVALLFSDMLMALVIGIVIAVIFKKLLKK